MHRLCDYVSYIPALLTAGSASACTHRRADQRTEGIQVLLWYQHPLRRRPRLARVREVQIQLYNFAYTTSQRTDCAREEWAANRDDHQAPRCAAAGWPLSSWPRCARRGRPWLGKENRKAVSVIMVQVTMGVP